MADGGTYGKAFKTSRGKKESGVKGLVGTQRMAEKVVGAGGFEPPTSWSRTKRADQAAPRPDCAGFNIEQKLTFRKFQVRLKAKVFNHPVVIL